MNGIYQEIRVALHMVWRRRWLALGIAWGVCLLGWLVIGAHAVLAEAGYGYSSSVAPLVHDHYGWPEAPRFAYRPLADSDFVELPVTTVQLGGRNFAAGGGGFFRLFPYALSRWAIRRVNQQDHRPASFYFHPWEIDPEQPRVAGAPLKSRMRHYVSLKRMAPKLQRLLGDFQWGRTDAVVAEQAALL